MSNLTWTCTDPDTEQFYAKINEWTYLYRQKDRNEEVIDLTKYSISEIENLINPFGYSLHPKDPNNIYKMYGKEANQIIAECIFELETS